MDIETTYNVDENAETLRKELADLRREIAKSNEEAAVGRGFMNVVLFVLATTFAVLVVALLHVGLHAVMGPLDDLDDLGEQLKHKHNQQPTDDSAPDRARDVEQETEPVATSVKPLFVRHCLVFRQVVCQERHVRDGEHDETDHQPQPSGHHVISVNDFDAVGELPWQDGSSEQKGEGSNAKLNNVAYFVGVSHCPCDAPERETDEGRQNGRRYRYRYQPKHDLPLPSEVNCQASAVLSGIALAAC